MDPRNPRWKVADAIEDKAVAEFEAAYSAYAEGKLLALAKAMAPEVSRMIRRLAEATGKEIPSSIRAKQLAESLVSDRLLAGLAPRHVHPTTGLTPPVDKNRENTKAQLLEKITWVASQWPKPPLVDHVEVRPYSGVSFIVFAKSRSKQSREGLIHRDPSLRATFKQWEEDFKRYLQAKLKPAEAVITDGGSMDYDSLVTVRLTF